MARIKGLGKLRAELSRFHEELSRINSSPRSVAEDESSQATDFNSSNHEDDAVWDSVDVKSSGPRVHVQKEYDLLNPQRSSQGHKYGLGGAAGKSSSRSLIQQDTHAYAGPVSNIGAHTPGTAGNLARGRHWKEETVKESKSCNLDAGCGEVNCKAAVWNGKKECECHLDQDVRISATSSFTANLGHVVSTEDGSSSRPSGFISNDELNAFQNGAIAAVPLLGEIAVQQPTGIRAEDATSYTTPEAMNIFASHQIACRGTGGIQVLSKGSVRSVGHDTSGRAAAATGSLTLRVATDSCRATSSFSTFEGAVVQRSSFGFGHTAEHPDGGRGSRPVKQTQAPDDLNHTAPKGLFQSHWENKVQSKSGKEDVLAARMASKVKQALQGLASQYTKHEPGYPGLRGGPSRSASQRVNKRLNYSSAPKSSAAQDPSCIDAESYLQDILAALSPEKSSEQGRTRRLSTMDDTSGKCQETAVELERLQDDQGQELDSKDGGVCNKGECLCPFQETDDKPLSRPSSLTGWPTSPKQKLSEHYRAVIEIPESAPISISYAAQDEVKPEKLENVTVNVTCSPNHVEPAKKCQAQLCPLEVCPAGCDDVQYWPEPPETAQVKDPMEKRFEDATRLLYNLDGKKGRTRARCALSRDCHWNSGKLSRQPQRPQKKAVPQNSKAKLQPKAHDYSKEQLNLNSQMKPKTHGTLNKRITAAAGLVEEIENLIATDKNDTMQEQVPYKYTRLDAPVTAAAHAVSKLTQEASTIDGDQSKWRQLFASQLGRTTYAQEAVKKLIGGGIDYDQLHKELNDINKERQKMIRPKQLSTKLLFTTNNLGKCWQEPCLLPGYQGQQQDDLFLNSLRQEVESRILSLPSGKRRRTAHSPQERKKKLIQTDGGDMLPGFPRAVCFQPPTNTSHPGTAEDLLMKRHATPQPSGTSKKLQNLVKEVEAMMKRTRSIAAEPKVSKAAGQSPQRENAIPQWLHAPGAQLQHNYKVEEYGPGSKHFVRAALRRKEVRPPETLFKSGVPTNWTVNVDPASKQPSARSKAQQHPGPGIPHEAYDYNQNVNLVNHTRSLGSKQKTKVLSKKGLESKRPGTASTAAKVKPVLRKPGRERRYRAKNRHIVGPVIDFDYPFERDRGLWPVPKVKERARKAEKPKAKKQDGGPVIDFSYKFESDRNLWPVVRKEQKAAKQRSRLESEWRRLEKDRRLVEIYGARLPRRGFGNAGGHALGSVAQSLLHDGSSLSSKGSRSSKNISDSHHVKKVHRRSDETTQSHAAQNGLHRDGVLNKSFKGLSHSHPTRKTNADRARSKSPLAGHTSSAEDEGIGHLGRTHERVPKGGHFDHLGSYRAKSSKATSELSSPSDHSKSSHSSHLVKLRGAQAGGYRLPAQLARKAIDGLLDTLTSEALHKEISALSTSAEGLGQKTPTGSKPGKDSSEEKYDTDEFYSDSEDPGVVQSKQSKTVARELKREKQELEAEVLEHALKEIVLQSVLNDQQRRLGKTQQAEGLELEESGSLLAEREYHIETYHTETFNSSFPSSSQDARTQEHGVHSTKNQVSFAGVQTSYDRKYAGSQTQDYMRSSAESQTPSYERRYAESQTSDSEQRDAVVQTTGYDRRYAESQTTDQEKGYAGVQTTEREQKFASVQTTDEPDHGDDSHQTAPKTGYSMKHVSAHESTPSTGKTRYYSPEYGRTEDEEGPKWEHDHGRGHDPSGQHTIPQTRQGRTYGRPYSPESPATPSTPPSDPAHEARLAAALALYPELRDQPSAETKELNEVLTPPHAHVTLQSTSHTVRFQTPASSESDQPADPKKWKTESGVQAGTLTSTIVTQTDEADEAKTSTIVTQTDEADEVKEEPFNPRLRRTRLRRLHHSEAVAFGMISKAVQSGSSSGESSSETSVPSAREPSALLSPGEVEGGVSMERLVLPRYSGLEQDLGTRYFKLKQYSGREAEMLMQDRHDPSNFSEGETDIGALYDDEEPGQAFFPPDPRAPGRHTEAGEIVWAGSNSPGERRSLSEGELRHGRDRGKVSR